MKTDQNPEAAPAEDSKQATTNLAVALPPPDAQAPPMPGKQDQGHDQKQETPPAAVAQSEAEAATASASGVAQTALSAVSATASRPDGTGRLATCETAGSAACATPNTAGPTPPAEQDQDGKAKPAKPDAIVLSSVLGTLDNLSEFEQADFFACEEVLGTGWDGFVQCGLALARIRDGRLYREQYNTFEDYCRDKWQYGRRYVNQLISAAQVFTYLGANRSQKKPEHETQVRPLVGLTGEQVVAAWELAVQKAGSGKITERLVKKAVQELQLGGPAKAVARKVGPTKAERRRLIDDTFGQLLALVSRKADHNLMQEKIEVLHGHVQSLFATKPRR
jgi:hypothetical protein